MPFGDVLIHAGVHHDFEVGALVQCPTFCHNDPMESGLPERDPGDPTVIPPEVVEAYRVTNYSFDIEECHVDFHLDEVCNPIADLIERFGSEGASLITAYNPLGKKLQPKENAEANEALLSELHTRRLQFLPAKGEEPYKSANAEVLWAEPGYMIFGLSRQEAIALGSRYKQNAIVWVSHEGLPELVLLR